jgi:hypothetical protein
VDYHKIEKSFATHVLQFTIRFQNIGAGNGFRIFFITGVKKVKGVLNFFYGNGEEDRASCGYILPNHGLNRYAL